MKLIDTHCHIDVAAFDTDRTEVLTRCREAGISSIIVPGIEAKSWDSLDRVCDQSDSLFPAYGLHPVYVDRHSDDDLTKLESRLQQGNPIAVGEIGLDYLFKKDLSKQDKARQQSLFEAQLALAQSASLPVLMHVRKSHDVVLSTLRRIPVGGGICHAFNGSLEQAHQYLELGFKLGFGGMLTYERSHKLHRLAKQLPIEAIVLETDAPDMTGASHHGQRNSPEYLPECLAALAQLRGEDIEYIAEQTTANAEMVLSLA